MNQQGQEESLTGGGRGGGRPSVVWREVEISSLVNRDCLGAQTNCKRAELVTSNFLPLLVIKTQPKHSTKGLIKTRCLFKKKETEKQTESQQTAVFWFRGQNLTHKRTDIISQWGVGQALLGLDRSQVCWLLCRPRSHRRGRGSHFLPSCNSLCPEQSPGSPDSEGRAPFLKYKQGWCGSGVLATRDCTELYSTTCFFNVRV